MKALKNQSIEELTERYLSLSEKFYSDDKRLCENEEKSLDRKMTNTQFLIMKKLAEQVGLDYLDNKVMTAFRQIIESYRSKTKKAV